MSSSRFPYHERGSATIGLVVFAVLTAGSLVFMSVAEGADVQTASGKVVSGTLLQTAFGLSAGAFALACVHLLLERRREVVIQQDSYREVGWYGSRALALDELTEAVVGFEDAQLVVRASALHLPGWRKPLVLRWAREHFLPLVQELRASFRRRGLSLESKLGDLREQIEAELASREKLKLLGSPAQRLGAEYAIERDRRRFEALEKALDARPDAPKTRTRARTKRRV